MRRLTLLAIGAAMLASPAFAQTARETDRQAPPQANARSGAGADRSQAGSEARSPGPPLDRGPSTPEANQAHRGGGAVLEGAPGAPAPAPQPTPPHDAPQSR
jgi:hypothetical protein